MNILEERAERVQSMLPEDKKYTVNVVEQFSRQELTWPFSTQDAAEEFIRRVDRMSGAYVTEYNFVYGSPYMCEYQTGPVSYLDPPEYCEEEAEAGEYCALHREQVDALEGLAEATSEDP